MLLRPIDKSDVQIVAGWLSEESVCKWLDFSAGRQVLSPAALAMMRQLDAHCLRIFCEGELHHAIGIVAISNIAKNFRSGTLWYALGERQRRGTGCTTRAVANMLDLAFGELGLTSVNAWAVAGNAPSIRILEKNRFHLIGKQRQCHLIDGRLQDRLLFDLLAEEHRAR